MNREKTSLAFFAAVLVTVVSVFALQQSNDHQECSTQTSTTTDANGNVTVTKQHQCQERFSL
jgi:ABC-type Fe3+-citrate transport system substrate-binding protein